MSDDPNPYRAPQHFGESESLGDGDAILRVTRTTSYADRVRAYRILVDGVERGRLSAGSSIDIPVTAGDHSVVAKIDWCSSPTVTETTQTNSIATLECASNLQGLRVFLAILYVCFFHDQYLTLTQT